MNRAFVRRTSIVSVLGVTTLLLTTSCGGGGTKNLSPQDALLAGRACDVLFHRSGIERCVITEFDSHLEPTVRVEVDTEKGHFCVYFEELATGGERLINVKSGGGCATQA
jgi:hypothetical protein